MRRSRTSWPCSLARSRSLYWTFTVGAASDALHGCCGEHGFEVARLVRFPDEPLPSPAGLAGAGVDCVAVYAGDGTVNTLVTGLYGWDGAVLVLPGGTMNLLAKRLHGDA